MLAGNADRERALDVLRAAFAEGRLTEEEHDERSGRALSARTVEELQQLTSDVPHGPDGGSVPGPGTVLGTGFGPGPGPGSGPGFTASPGAGGSAPLPGTFQGPVPYPGPGQRHPGPAPLPGPYAGLHHPARPMYHGPVYPQAPVYPYPQPYPQMYPYAPQPLVPYRPTNPAATGALVCGLVTPLTLGISGLPAVILGHKARAEIRRTGDRGDGTAVAGLALGWLAMGLLLLALLAS
ncbi:DUF1707 and DUF4190 domain-containing protein [Streptomyces sp. N2-109]|uniref:DUF1707 and DUF4190 domain-containing protein n=1 Tax=Streptomyces gossypii TaxID=2883101 RepID=A0ABT2JWD4_9ACTN|nr:DUF1707 and DUF4190 domain-containing protein [Streptomyces gossypii]MCT2592215.1 DUF1707 and DUF4190 domain-containing protein [Streptomyces gossypii]